MSYNHATFKPLLPALSRLLAPLLKTGILPILAISGDFLRPNQHNPTTWNAAAAAFARCRLPSLALHTVSLMHRLDLPLDSYALCTALTAATSFSTAAKIGAQIHSYSSKSGWMSSIFFCGALIDSYAKSGDVDGAHQLFDEIPNRNTVCLNALLSGYVESKRWVEALSLFRAMHELSLDPDGFTMAAVLRICAEVALARLGAQVHAHMIRKCIELDVFLLSSLVEMYGKCGLVGNARMVFELAGRATVKGRRDVILWTSMLNAYGRNGAFQEVIGTFQEMLVEGTEPDEVAFLAVLSACRSVGSVQIGLKHFESMSREYGMVPRSEHYGCVVDMLCKAGELEKAWSFADEMVLEGDGAILGVTVWGALLSACKDCGNVEIGKVAAQRALQLDPNNVGIFVELSNLYANAGMWGEIGELREMISEKGLKKDVGRSWMEHIS